jgi:predicted homoserine dehydrogenase-like protein
MLTSFIDGTKTMVEMTCVSNATGFLPTKKGLIGPEATVKELPKLFSLKEQGGILERYQVVEYVNGVAPGVFVIVTTNLPAVREEWLIFPWVKGQTMFCIDLITLLVLKHLYPQLGHIYIMNRR